MSFAEVILCYENCFDFFVFALRNALTGVIMTFLL